MKDFFVLALAFLGVIAFWSVINNLFDSLGLILIGMAMAALYWIALVVAMLGLAWLTQHWNKKSDTSL